MEARVLAGQPGWEVADRCGLPPEVVEAYERIHFDLRDRLGAPDYIAAVVIGISPVDGLPASDLDAILRGYAYRGGPHVLDALLGVLDLGAEGEVRMTAALAVVPALARTIRMAILARTIPAAGRGATELIRLHARLAEVEREAASEVALASPIRATVEPFPAEHLPGQDVRMTQPDPDRTEAPGIGPDLDWCPPRGRAAIAAPLAGAASSRPGRASRRTA